MGYSEESKRMNDYKEIIVKEYHNEKGLVTRREIGEEIVRCKDCMYNDRGWCGSQEYGTRHVEDNDYCSYGERKKHE